MSVSLEDIRFWMTEYIMTIFLGVGLLGNLLNMYMFLRKDFSKNSCCLYLAAASMMNLLTLIWGIGPTIYNLYQTDPSTYSYLFCKLRLYTIHTPLMIGRSLIVCACIDRYLLCSQSAALRSFCEPKMAQRIIIGNILIWPVITIHIPILQVFSNYRCFMSSSYVIIYGFYSTMAAGLLPPLLMTVFSILTIRHRHQLRSRVTTLTMHSRRNNTLIVMLSTQVIVYVTTTSLYPATTLYRALTNDYQKSLERLQIENFISFIGGSFLIYLNPASPFYVYLVASKQFRKDFQMILIHFFRQCIGRIVRIQPLTN